MSREEIQAQRRALRKAYGRLYDEVSEILFRHDPMGINFETNTDEYEPEAGSILPRLAGAAGPADVSRIVREELASWFAPMDVAEESRYTDLAAEVWSAYQRFKAQGSL